MPPAINYPPAGRARKKLLQQSGCTPGPSTEALRLEHRLREPSKGYAGASRQGRPRDGHTWEGPILHAARSPLLSRWCLNGAQHPARPRFAERERDTVRGLRDTPQPEGPGLPRATLGTRPRGVGSGIRPIPAPSGSRQRGGGSVPPRQPSSPAPLGVGGRCTAPHADAGVVWVAATLHFSAEVP